MNRNRLLVLGVGATSVGVACLVACGDAEPGAALIGDDDAGRPEASLPPESDAGVEVIADAGPEDADAEPSTPDADLSDRPVTCATTPCVVELAGAAGHFCARMSDGTIQCWGRNDRGSLGRGPDAGVTSARPAPVVGIASATQLTASSSSSATCARLADERVQCWGENVNAQLGLTAPTVTRDSFEHHTPADLAIPESIARVAVGSLNGCAVASDGGDLYCWGSNANQALARSGLATTGTGMFYAPALAEQQGIELTPMAMGYRTSFGLTKDGQLVSWGMNSGRQSSLSHALPTEHATP
ncbi:MAG: hypothetical protein KF894_16680, partial [Labilithrix sp.]|nr:hypothetical protein [Labilithrix sp.]